jgi:hypothetical protein
VAQIEPHPWTDPIVEEVRAARAAIAARYDYDVEKLAAAFAERSKASGRKTASPAAAITNGAGQPAVRSTTGTH